MSTGIEERMARLLPSLITENPCPIVWQAEDFPILLPALTKILADSSPRLQELSDKKLAKLLIEALWRRANRMEVVEVRSDDDRGANLLRYEVWFLRRHWLGIGWLWAKEKYWPPFSRVGLAYLDRDLSTE